MQERSRNPTLQAAKGSFFGGVLAMFNLKRVNQNKQRVSKSILTILNL